MKTENDSSTQEASSLHSLVIPLDSERPVESGESSGLVGVGGVLPPVRDSIPRDSTPRVDAIPRRGPFHHYIVDDVLALARQLERELREATRWQNNAVESLHDLRDMVKTEQESRGHAERAGEEWKAEAIAGRERISWLEQQREIEINRCAAAIVERDGADKVCDNLRKELSEVAASNLRWCAKSTAQAQEIAQRSAQIETVLLTYEPRRCKHCGLTAEQHGPALYEGAKMECPDGMGWSKDKVFSPL